MRGTASLLAFAFCLIASPAQSDADVRNVKFGILKQVSPGEYRMDVQTTRIPRKLKETGFRFGIEFENPNREAIDWFEVVHLPAPLKEASGDTRKVAPEAIQTDLYRSSDARIVDHFWFDEGDPLGMHRLELFVKGQRIYSVSFEVVSE
jgi:hypothetical protein